MQVKGTIFDDLNAMKLVDDGLIDGIELENVFALKAKITSADAQDAEGNTPRALAFLCYSFNLKYIYLFSKQIIQRVLPRRSFLLPRTTRKATPPCSPISGVTSSVSITL